MNASTRTRLTLILLVSLALGGYFFYKGFGGALRLSRSTQTRTLRYTNDLVGVDSYAERAFLRTTHLESLYRTLIAEKKQRGGIADAEVVFHELSRGGWANAGSETMIPDSALAPLFEIFSEHASRYPNETIFEEIGIAPTQMHALTSEALYWRALYNATYLGREDSESALSRFATEDTLGLRAGLPPRIPFIHLPWSAATERTSEFIAGDCGIGYDERVPFVLCAYARGKDTAEIASFLREVSETTYAALPTLYSESSVDR